MDILKLAHIFNKLALTKPEFEKLLNGQQFAIISGFTEYERINWSNLPAYTFNHATGKIESLKLRDRNKKPHETHIDPNDKKFNDIELARLNKKIDKENESSFERAKSKLHENFKDDANLWQQEEILGGWGSEEEPSILLRNISLENAWNLAKRFNQESFIFKPHNGPVQFIDVNGGDIKVSKTFAWRDDLSLYSKFAQSGTSFEFGYAGEDVIELPNYGKAYTWGDSEIQQMFTTKEEVKEDTA